MEMKTLLGTFLVLIVMLGLAPVFATSLMDAKYGPTKTDTFEYSSTGQACELTYGNIRNDTVAAGAYQVYITVKMNGTALKYGTGADGNYTVTSLGDYSDGGVITTTHSSKAVKIDITYRYLIPSAQVTLLNMLPLLYVLILLVSIAVVLIKMLDKTKT